VSADTQDKPELWRRQWWQSDAGKRSWTKAMYVDLRVDGIAGVL
jgi:hypothetical protein